MKKDNDEIKEIKQAAALKYEAGKDNAPYITALGKGYLAQRMIEQAQKNKVNIIEDKKLSHMLGKLSVGDEIPEELYTVVAEILVLISNMDSEYKSKMGL